MVDAGISRDALRICNLNLDLGSALLRTVSWIAALLIVMAIQRKDLARRLRGFNRFRIVLFAEDFILC